MRNRIDWVVLGATALVVGCGNSDSGGTTATDSGMTQDGGPKSSTSSTSDAGSVSVGSFVVTVTAPTDSAAGSTTLIGQVYDGVYPSTTQWTTRSTTGDCSLLIPSTPYCATSCDSSAACVATDTCQTYPKKKSVAEVVVSGVKTVGAASVFTMTPTSGVYQPDESLAYPPFTQNDVVQLSTDGGSYEKFAIRARGIAPLTLTNAQQTLSASSNLSLTWTAAASGTSRVSVLVDISHHGGLKGKIVCDTADDGSLDVDKSLVAALLKLGVAGWPTVTVSRTSSGSATITPGRVDFILSSSVDQPVTIPGIQSCTQDSACSDGGTSCSTACDGGVCKSDLTCQ